MSGSVAPRSRPPAVLVGLDSLQGIQAARILHGCGIPVIAVAADPRHPACRTNVCERLVLADTRGPELLEALDDLGSKLSGEVLLVPCQDKSVRVISRNRDMLSEHFTIVLPPPDVVELLMDKDAFHAYATEQGLPIPTTVDLVDREDAVRAAEDLEFPLVIKPRARTREWDEQTKLKVFKADSPASLLDIFDRCRPWADRLIAQQWIEGGDDSLYSCNCYFDRDSRPLATFVARKLRQWPPGAGSSCLGEEVRNNQVLETTLSLFGGLSYRGLGYLEMKRDARTARQYIIEPNVGRPTGRSAIAEAGGVPLLYTMYCDAMGLPLPQERTQRYSGAKWVYLRHDLQSASVYWRRGELSLREWARSLRGRKAFAMLSRSDPAPFLADLWRAIGLAVKRVMSRLRPNRPKRA
ncbi:MAG: carboxylate--amine ligase [Gemmatimonadota bacterium]